MSDASIIPPIGDTLVISCPICLGVGHDGSASWNFMMTSEAYQRNREQHKCRTCDGCGRVRVEILGPDAETKT